MEPLVGQGWTLVYEMLFYSIFACMLFLPRRRAVMAASAALIALVAIGKIFPNMHPTFERWCDPIIIEFIFGMAVGLAYREGLILNKTIAAGLVALGLIILVLDQAYLFSGWRAFAAGVPAALVVLGSTTGRFPRVPVLAPLSLLLGDTSYALYLFHPTVTRAFIVVSRWVGFNLAHFPLAYFFASFVVAIVSAIILHECLERPLMRYLRARAKFIERAPPMPPQSKPLKT
jgi:peptidoglycan/LPS O-acetylase OafA/YrhL